MNMTKAPIDFDNGDSLSDLLGDDPSFRNRTNSLTAVQPPRVLPQDEQLARIRARGTGEVPAAPVFKVPCQKCGGSGIFRSYSGRTVGPCFTCKGKGFFERKQSAQTLAANRASAATRKERIADENRTTFAEKFPAEHAWIVKNAPTFSFASAMDNAVRKYGDLTPRQLAAVQGCVEKEKARAAVVAEQTKAIDVANIVDCFRRAREAGLKRFTLRFADAHFQADKNDPALIWVSKAGYGTDKYGRIQSGVYKPGYHASAEVLARIAEISKDPMAAAMAYAQVTSSCSVCGRHLENQDSVDAGIGPICAGRINRPGSKFVSVEKGDF